MLQAPVEPKSLGKAQVAPGAGQAEWAGEQLSGLVRGADADQLDAVGAPLALPLECDIEVHGRHVHRRRPVPGQIAHAHRGHGRHDGIGAMAGQRQVVGRIVGTQCPVGTRPIGARLGQAEGSHVGTGGPPGTPDEHGGVHAVVVADPPRSNECSHRSAREEPIGAVVGGQHGGDILQR